MRWFQIVRKGGWQGLLILLAAGLLGLLAWQVTLQHWSSAKSATRRQLDTLHALCVQDMVANTCKVMGTGSSSVTAKPGDLVFVAGVGSIDAVAYQQMYSAGDAMCGVVLEACARQWDGAQCMTARTMYRL